MENETTLTAMGLIPIDEKDKNFNLLMNIYQMAGNQVFQELLELKDNLNRLYDYEVINNITYRIKTPFSILNKMKKKNCELNYKNLIEKIKDVAGLRVICPLKADLFTVVDLIEQLPNINIIEEKDFIKKPKKSGYSGYHLIVETLIMLAGKEILVKVEIQLRTMAMDFWATNEHKIKYKTNKKLSFFDSKRLVYYAKLINFLDDRISRLSKKQAKKEVKLKLE